MRKSPFSNTYFELIFIFTALLIASLVFPFSTAKATTVTFTNRSDWESGTAVDLNTDVSENSIQLEAAGTWGARSWKTPDLALSAGAAFASDGTDIYVTKGLGDVLFWKYTPKTDSWTTLAQLPKGTYYGSDLEVLGNYVYMIFGGYQKTFARYSIENNVWEILEETPDLIYTGGSLAADGTDIYLLKGNSSQDFYRYDVSENTWTPLIGPTVTIGAGASLVRVGNYLYTPRGNNSNIFLRYDLVGGGWSTLSTLPATMSEQVKITTNGTNIFVTRQSNTTTFYSYSIIDNSWTTLKTLPANARYAGSVFHSEDGYVYVFQGNGQFNFWKYDIANNSFVGPEDCLGTLGVGSDFVYYSGYLYVPRGNNTVTFYRYNITTNSWETLENAPAAFNDDTKGVAAGSYLYFFGGSNTNNFYRYDPAKNKWESLANTLASVRFGGSLVYPGSGDFLYATRGATTRTFWRYSITDDSWEDNLITDTPVNAEASYGSRLVSDGSDIYYLPGVGISRWFKYSTSGNNWTELAASPFAPYYGSDIAYYNGKILALAGWYKNDLWEYTISDNLWRKLPSTAGYLAQNLGAYTGASIEYDGSNSFYVSLGNSRTNIIAYTPGDTSYISTGNWTSVVQDLGYVSSWNGFSSDTTINSNSAITFKTRTSADNINWDEWKNVVNSTIASSPQRYLQVKADFFASSSSSDTPILNQITIDYIGDTTAPSNPVTVTGLSQEIGGATLTDGESYRHTSPYFTWSGATDGQTNVSGYFVYFGLNSLADPESLGEYQTTDSYLATKPLSTNTYYLRLKTKDAADNISEAETLFTYIYTGISPPQSLTVDETSEFTGVGTKSNIANDAIKLESRTNGFWLEQTLSTTPGTMQYGAKTIAYVSTTNKLYAFRGNNSPTLYTYDIDTDTWSTLTNAPDNVQVGGGIVEGPSGYLYGIQGNNDTSFWRYNIDDNEWSDESAADTPLTISYGSSMVFDGSRFIYVTRGNGDDAFWRYDTNEDTWETLTNIDFGASAEAINNNVSVGGDLAINQAEGLIYATQGNLLDGFSVYNINTGAWTILPDVPHLPYYGSAIDYTASNGAIYYIPGYYSDKLYKFNIGDQTWTEMAKAPVVFYYGATIRNVGEYLYVIQGNNTTGFYKYNLAKNSWMTPNRGLFGKEFQGTSYLTENYGADIVKGNGNYFYITRGNFSDEFIRWNSVTGETTKMKSTPVGLYNGSSLVYDSTANKIYLTGGAYVQKFYVYDIATDVWIEEEHDPPLASINYGSSMVYDGTRYIYLSRGAATSNFYRFDTQGTETTKWSALASAPAGLGYGSELLLRDNYIYTLQGQNVNNNPFYRYDIALNTWSNPAVSDLNIDVYNDGFLADGNNGNFYAAKGDNDNSFYQYSLQADTWTKLDNAPARVYVGGAGESNGSNKIFMLSGAGTGSYADAVYTYVIPTASSAFTEAGSYTSPTHDLTSVYKWSNLVVEYQTATNTSLEIQTRSSTNGSSWSSWTAVAAGKNVGTTYTYQIKSPPARYLQINFDLNSSDGIYSGIIDGYTVNYYKDTTLPTNPETEGLSGYASETDLKPIISGTWYGHQAPYFTWPSAESTRGASDTAVGSGIIGYYVYFGTNDQADPVIDGQLQTENTYTGAGLVDGSTYYLRIKTLDDAGNVSADVWQPFIYQFDGAASAAPANVTADPAGYTATNSFNFTWDTVTSTGATIAEYCYKTGATSGSYAVDQCTSKTNVTAIPAYKVGTNDFYVRAKDVAGNYSQYSSVFYYYVDSDNAPAPPTNLQVSPLTNTENSFSFSWDPPVEGTYYGSPSNLSYYYSVNALPTVQSTTATSLCDLIAGAYATLPGENVFYITTKDEAGNINYDDYASVTFSANTTAPGIPLNIDIADVSVKSTKSWKLALSWEAPESGGGVSSYSIYRSTDGENFSTIASSGGISFVDTGLIQQTYYYKVKACDNTNNCGAFSQVVSLFPDGKYVVAAEIVAEPTVSAITTKKATVSWSTARAADSKISYGTSSGDYFEEEVANSDQVTSHTLNLSNLSPGTTYYLIAKWTDEDGNTGTAAEQSFATAPPPSTKEPVAKNIGLDSALIEFVSQNASSIKVYYGETSAFGGVENIVTGAAEGTHAVQLTGLEDGTKYFYKINSYDSEGEEYEGEIHSFTTLQRPKISNIKISQVKGTAQSTLLVIWDSNTAISSIVTYYPLTSPAMARDEVDINYKKGQHQLVLTELLPQTTYALLVKGKDAAGNEAIGEVQQVSTAADTRPPQITDLKVEGEILGSGDEATAQLVISYKTDEAATSQIEFGEGSGTTYSQKTQEDATLTNNHLIVISELTPAKVYHLRAISKDSFTNQNNSLDKVVVTPNASDNALDLVVNNMLSIFNFLSP